MVGERELDRGPTTARSSATGPRVVHLARREAIESAGFLDERFFMYSEETDLCRRISSAGWEVRHVPWMTILHYGAKVGVDPSIESLSAYNRIVYARKHSPRCTASLLPRRAPAARAPVHVRGTWRTRPATPGGQPGGAQNPLGRSPVP